MLDQTVIQADQLSYYYGTGEQRHQVLTDIAFVLPAGEICVLTGPSGSGKTTMLSLCGALRDTRVGSLQVLGVELTGADEVVRTKIRRRIGFIFQHHNLLGFLTARQNVMVAAELAGVGGSRAQKLSIELLGRVGLFKHSEKFPAQLSGGQRQRVAIARALAGAPRLILADEPTASLDAEAAANISELLKSIAIEQLTAVLLVTHDPRVMKVAGRVVQMQDGKLIDC